MYYFLEVIKFITCYAWIWMFPVIIFMFMKIYKEKDEEVYESNLVLKMIGFYILGGFNFSLNGIISIPILLPLGYCIYHFFMKDNERSNKVVKYKCAVFGVIMLYVGFLNGLIYNSLEYRDYRIKNYSANVRDIKDEWNYIKEKLHLDDNNMLEEFRISYDKDDKIQNVHYNFINENENKYFVVSDDLEGRYHVQVQKYRDDQSGPTWGWFDDDYRNINVDEFMKIISNIEFAKSPLEENKNIATYDVVYSAYDSTTASDEYENSIAYIIESEDGSVYRKAKRRELPLVGSKINYIPMKRVTEGHTESVSNDCYLLFPSYGNMLIKDSTEKLTIYNLKEDKFLEVYSEDNTFYDVYNYLDTESWEEIEKSEVKESPYLIIKDDSETTITIYEKSNYAVYEDKDGTAYFRVNDYSMENLRMIKYQ